MIKRLTLMSLTSLAVSAAAAVVLLLAAGPVLSGEASEPRRYATLKFDDLKPRSTESGVSEIEQKVAGLLQGQGIAHAWGVCRLGDEANPPFYRWLKARHAEGVEIWNHGNRHDRDRDKGTYEFKGRDEASQWANLKFTQDRIRAETGIVMQTFGAPYNATDKTTGRVLNRLGEIKIAYFIQASPDFSGLKLNDRVNLERKTGVVADLEAFKKSYEKQRDREIIVLQGHPAYWNEQTDIPKLQAIIAFAKDQGREFITPSDYYNLKAQ